ncbi:hypothetical protein [Gymnodinialimonas sp. 57CJ19]|uniref:hypothetical protein n=1 Tax=Gymnodinialimonas sp. 57CJ19 TaxID=3138498 RepID=UPI0031343A32
MVIKRLAIAPKPTGAIAIQREACLGCADCQGTCLELMQMALLPEFPRRRREGKL